MYNNQIAKTNEKFKNHKNYTNYKTIQFKHMFDSLEIKYSKTQLIGLLIQSILQRNNKKRSLRDRPLIGINLLQEFPSNALGKKVLKNGKINKN